MRSSLSYIQKYGLVLVLLFMVFGSQNGFSREPGLPFLKLGVGARAQSLGNAYIASVNDASANFWNPSALSGLQQKQFFFYHSRMASDYNHSYIAYAHPFQNQASALGVALGYFSKGNYDGRNSEGQPTGQFSASDSVATVSYGRALGLKAQAGFSLNLLRSNIASHNAFGYGMNVSGSYQFSRLTRAALGFFNLGPSMKYITESFQLPSSFTAGLSHRLFEPLTLTSGIQYGLYDERFSLSFGGELDLANASLRLGYLSNLAESKEASSNEWNNLSGISMGIGLKLFTRTDLNYAFVPMGILGGTHHMDLGWRF